MATYGKRKLKGNKGQILYKACVWGTFGFASACGALLGGLYIGSNPAIDKNNCKIPSRNVVTAQALDIGANTDIMYNRLYVKRGVDCKVVVQKDLPDFVKDLLVENVDLINRVFDVVNDEYNFVVLKEGENGASLNDATITITTKDIDAMADVILNKDIVSSFGNGFHGAKTRSHIRLDDIDFINKFAPSLDKAPGEYISPYVKAYASRVLLHELMHCLGTADYESKAVNGNYIQCFYDTNNVKHFLYDTDGNLSRAYFNSSHQCMNRMDVDQYGNSCYGMKREPSIMEYDIVHSYSKDVRLYQMDVKFILSSYNNDKDKLAEKLDKLIDDKYMVLNNGLFSQQDNGRL